MTTAAQRSTAFQFTVSRGPRVLVQHIAADMTFLLALFTEGAGNGFFRLVNPRHLRRICISLASRREVTSDIHSFIHSVVCLTTGP